MADLLFEPLDRAKHDRAAFSCGEDKLDQWLKTQAAKEAESRSCAIMVAVDDDAPNEILGFYSLSSLSVPLAGLNQEQVKTLKLPRYAEAGVTLLGRLARSVKTEPGFGRYLVVDAILSAYTVSQSVGSIGVVVDPKNERLAEWYRCQFDFVRLPNSTRLLLPMVHAKKLLLAADLIDEHRTARPARRSRRG